MENFNLIKYYNQMRLTGLDDAQIAASLGITVEALLAALGEQGYYATVHLPKKFTILTYKNGTAQIDPWFYTYIKDAFLFDGGAEVWFQHMPSSDSDEHDKRAYLAFLDKLFYTTFTFTDKQTLKDAQINPFAGDCNFGVYLEAANAHELTFNVVCASYPNHADQSPLVTFHVYLETDPETGDTRTVLDDNIEINQEDIDAAHIQSITVSMMSLYYE